MRIVHVSLLTDTLQVRARADIFAAPTRHVTCSLLRTPTRLQELRDYQLERRVSISLDGQRLTVVDAQLSDIGDYYCVARNLVGEKRKDFDVDVHEPPYFSDGDGHADVSIAVRVDDAVNLTCPFNGYPFPKVQWSKNRMPIDDRYYRLVVLPGGRGREKMGKGKRGAGRKGKVTNFAILYPKITTYRVRIVQYWANN